MKLVKTAVSGFLKDEETKIIVNDNLAEFEVYKAARLKVQQQKSAENEIHALKQTVSTLQSDIGDIKNMLAILIEKK